MSTRNKSLIAGFFSALLGLAMWLVFAPVTLGGSTAYVILIGNSMEPKFHRYDLVIVRAAAEYHIGDAVAYEHPMIGGVFHRIVDKQGELFILQGDNNDWLDTHEPTGDEIIGKLWLHFPGGGKLINFLRQPVMFTALTLSVGVMMVGSLISKPEPDSSTSRRKRMERRMNPPRDVMTFEERVTINPVAGQAAPGTPVQRKPMNELVTPPPENIETLPAAVQRRFVETAPSVARAIPAGPLETVAHPRPQAQVRDNALEMLMAAGVVAVVLLVLAIVAFTRPLTVMANVPMNYSQKAAITYSAKASSGVYDGSVVSPGEPIFRRLAESFNVAVNYTLSSPYATEVRGLYRMVVEIADISGWKRTIEIVPDTYFDGKGFEMQGTVRFADVQQHIDRLKAETGLLRTEFTMTVRTEVTVLGTLDGITFENVYAPQLVFGFDDLQVQLMKPPANPENAFEQVSIGSVPREVEQDNVLTILGIKVPVKTARVVAVVGLNVMVLVIGYLGSQVYRAFRQGEAAQVEVLYGPMLVSVEDDVLPRRRPVKVASVHELAKIAERDQCMIYHMQIGELHRYMVQSPVTPEVTYLYEIRIIGEVEA